jgi:hypothetical protein
MVILVLEKAFPTLIINPEDGGEWVTSPGVAERYRGRPGMREEPPSTIGVTSEPLMVTAYTGLPEDTLSFENP